MAEARPGQAARHARTTGPGANGQVRPPQRFLLGQQLAHIDFLDVQIAALGQQITHLLESVPPAPPTAAEGAPPEAAGRATRPAFAARRRRGSPHTSPALHQRQAEIIVSELGTDMRRFPSAAHAAAAVRPAWPPVTTRVAARPSPAASAPQIKPRARPSSRPPGPPRTPNRPTWRPSTTACSAGGARTCLGRCRPFDPGSSPIICYNAMNPSRNWAAPISTNARRRPSPTACSNAWRSSATPWGSSPCRRRSPSPSPLDGHRHAGDEGLAAAMDKQSNNNAL